MWSARKWLTLAAPADLVVLAAGAVPAVSSVPASKTRPGAATATTPHVKDVVHLIHRGLVHDCEYIRNDLAGKIDIAGGGVNTPVKLVSPPGNCWNLYNEFYYSNNGHTYTGYEYQNGDGHCLWDNFNTTTNMGTIDVGAPCKALKTTEEFFAVSYGADLGWLWSVISAWPGPNGGDFYVDAPGCSVNTQVVMDPVGDSSCQYWNFPQS